MHLQALTLCLIAYVFWQAIRKRQNNMQQQPKKQFSFFKMEAIKIELESEDQPIALTNKKKRKKHKKVSVVESKNQIIEEASQVNEYDDMKSREQQGVDSLQTTVAASQLIQQEIEIIRATFPRQFQELTPHSPKTMGSYTVEMQSDDAKRDLKIQWGYQTDDESVEPVISIVDITAPKYMELKIRELVSDGTKKRSQDDGHLVLKLLVELQRLLADRPPQIAPQPQKTVPRVEEQTVNQEQLSIHNVSAPFERLVDMMINPFLPGDNRQKPQFEQSHEVTQNEPSRHNGQSKYQNQFKELNKLGGGGFGSVFLARNNLDKNLNAVKKIPIIEADPQLKRVEEQVILLSSLNHPNIVRYYQTWVQSFESLQRLQQELQIEEDSEEWEMIQFRYQQCLKQREHGEVVFAYDDSNSMSEEMDDNLSMSAISGSYRLRDKSNLSLIKDQQSLIYADVKHQSEEDSSGEQPKLKKKSIRIRYIAMEYCDGETLKHLIENELCGQQNSDALQELKTRVLRNILEALVYIHDKKITHRDLKPANIFLDKKRQKVKLGDFGLAKSIEDGMPLKGNVGTARYKAPELKDNNYTEKIDIYSLGIIIFEIYYTKKIATQFEKQEVLRNLRESKFPPDFDDYCRNPEIRPLIQAIVSKNPNDRPTAQYILSRVKNKLFVDLVSALTNPDHFQFRSLLDSLFEIKTQGFQNVQREPYRFSNISEVEQTFKAYGGYNIHISPIIPVQDHKTLNRLKVQSTRDGKLLTLSQDGCVIELCSNAYQPWIRWIRDFLSRGIRKQPRVIHRYSFSEIYERIGEQLQIQQQRIVGCFDIVDQNLDEARNRQLKMLLLTKQLCDSEDSIIYLSHSFFLRALIKQIKLSEEMFYRIILSEPFMNQVQIDTEQWQQVFTKHDVPINTANRLLKFFRVQSESSSQLISLFISELGLNNLMPQFQAVSNQLEQLAKLLQVTNFPEKSIIWKVMVPPQNTCGLFWKVPRKTLQKQIHALKKQRTNSRLLISGFVTTEDTRSEPVLSLHLEVQLSQACRPMLQVIVWSIGMLYTEEMIKLVSQCWQAGISAQWRRIPERERVQGAVCGLALKKNNNSKKLTYGLCKNGALHAKIDWKPIEQFSIEQIRQFLAEVEKEQGTSKPKLDD